MANNSSAAPFTHYASLLWNSTIIPRSNIYIVTPSESSFANVEDVPDYINQSVPFWFGLMFVEFLLAHYMGKRPTRLNDMFSSLSAGMIEQMTKVMFLGFKTALYIHIYNNYRVVDLPWNSLWLWWACILGYDLGYYFAHRAGHEINLLWAAHQMHHSSEAYNLSTAMRQSVFQGFFFWVFYVPLALFIPPSIFKAHSQFNLMYQFWIHTELIDNLGPLEWVLNTPSHHRVHHGRNANCLDKNYGAVLIIWDRIFGTFEPEPEKRDVAYGLVYPIEFWDPLKAQVHYYQYIFQKAWNTEGLGTKLQFLFRGPGWTPPGEEVVPIPEVKYPVKPFNRDLPTEFVPYILVHWLLLVAPYFLVVAKKVSTTLGLWLLTAYIVLSLSSFGMMFDHKWHAPGVELFRLALVLTVEFMPATATLGPGFFFPDPFALFGRLVFAASCLFWFVLLLRQCRGGRAYWQKPGHIKMH